MPWIADFCLGLIFSVLVFCLIWGFFLNLSKAEKEEEALNLEKEIGKSIEYEEVLLIHNSKGR